MLRAPQAAFAVLLLIAVAGDARAAADGPDFWDVTGVKLNDALNMRAAASADAAILARIPARAMGLKNLGCSGVPSFADWQKMTAAARAAASKARWCKVEHQGQQGWVAGRYLKEGVAPASAAASPASATAGSPAALAPWSIRCGSSGCSIEQVGVGAQRRTVLRISAKGSGDTEISIERANLPRSGTLMIFMDGEQISGGPIAQLRSRDGRRMVMPPEDITAGLLKQMVKRENMVLSFPGEDRGVEISLKHFEAALAEVRRRAGGDQAR